MIPVYENYKGYRPPRYAHPTVAKLLSMVPPRYLCGLQSVVLTDGEAIGKGKTRRVAGKKYARDACLGFYHAERRGEQAWIEIVVDNIVEIYSDPRLPRFLSHVPVVRNVAFAYALYHELGHHLECILGAPARVGEAAAEAWQRRLLRSYFRKSYWYLVPFLGVAKKIVARLAHLDDSGRPRSRGQN
jgi:hypothetical protein